MAPPKKPDAQTLNVRLSTDDLAAADRIAAELAKHTDLIPNRSRVLAWAIRELDARIALAGRTRGAAPVFTEAGPIAPPPGRAVSPPRGSVRTSPPRPPRGTR